MKLEHSLTSHTKKFKVEDLKQDAIKLLEENTGKTFSDLNRSNIFLDKSSKAKYIETKMYKYDLIKLISFYLAKTTNKMRQFTKRDKIFANDDPNKGLISKTYKQLKQINIETKQHQAELSVLYRSFPLAILYEVVYICQKLLPQFVPLSPYPTVSTSPFSTFVSLFCPANRFISPFF